jgi:hypothetical protein
MSYRLDTRVLIVSNDSITSNLEIYYGAFEGNGINPSSKQFSYDTQPVICR